MNCFLGIVVLDSINNHKTYNIVIREILHYLHCHQSDIKLTQTSHLVTVHSLHNTNSFTLPKHGQYVHSCHYKVSFSEAPTESEMSYFKNILECLLIVKQHFPSKIEIQAMTESQYLETRLDNEVEQGIKDLSRRYISHLRTLLLKVEDITQEQINDIFYIIRKQDSSKLINLALSILKKSPQNLFLSINQIELSVLQQLCQHQEYEKNIRVIFEKIAQNKKSNKQQKLEESRKSMLTSRTKYDEPTILNSFIFQLRESNNIQRLGFLFEKINGQIYKLDKESIQKIDKAIFCSVQRILEVNRIDNSQEALIFANNLLKYLILRKQVLNWDIVIELLVQSSNHPTIIQGINATFEVFFGQFKERADQSIVNDLIYFFEAFNKMGKININKQIRKDIVKQQNCRTSRNTMLKGRKTTKSMYTK